MRFVDRIQEIERLTKILNMDRPTFTAIYGRRRLGKSTLITRVITDNDIYYHADESESSAQRLLLSKVIAQKFAGFDKMTYPDWELRENHDKKKILIGECKWTSGENAVALENELRWKASMLPFAKGKEIVPVIFAKNVSNQSDTAIVITPKDIMDLMK